MWNDHICFVVESVIAVMIKGILTETLKGHDNNFIFPKQLSRHFGRPARLACGRLPWQPPSSKAGVLHIFVPHIDIVVMIMLCLFLSCSCNLQVYTTYLCDVFIVCSPCTLFDGNKILVLVILCRHGEIKVVMHYFFFKTGYYVILTR